MCRARLKLYTQMAFMPPADHAIFSVLISQCRAAKTMPALRHLCQDGWLQGTSLPPGRSHRPPSLRHMPQMPQPCLQAAQRRGCRPQRLPDSTQLQVHPGLN